MADDPQQALRELDVITCAFLNHAPNVVIPHTERGLLLAPISFIDKKDGDDFAKTHKRAAFPTLSALEGRHWSLVGRLERHWVLAEQKR